MFFRNKVISESATFILFHIWIGFSGNFIIDLRMGYEFYYSTYTNVDI